MRLVGIIAVFVLALATIVEGAFLVRLSGQVADLKEEMRLPGRSPIEEPDPAALAARSASATLAAERAATRRAPVPRLEPTAAPADPTGDSPPPPATEVLRGALSTAEGRDYLNKALQTIREEARQADMIKDIAGDQERERSYRERLGRTLGLSSSEQGSIGSLHANLQSARQRVLDEMRSGQKSAEQADNEIDKLVDNTEKSIEALIGEPRLRQMRDAKRVERQQRQLMRQQQGQGGAAAPPRAQLAQPPN